MKEIPESLFNDQKGIQTMAAAIASTVPAHGSVNVGIDGSPASASGEWLQLRLHLDRLHVVRTVSQTDQIHQTASS